MFLNRLFCFESSTLAVVPVFVNAGAALLPALFAGLTATDNAAEVSICPRSPSGRMHPD